MGGVNGLNELPANEIHNFPPGLQRMHEAAMTLLWEGGRVTLLSFVLLPLNMQMTYSWSDASVDALLRLLAKFALPVPNKLPLNRSEIRRMLKAMGLPYETYHACKNDCIIFRQEYAQTNTCPTCSEDRFKPTKGRSVKQVPWKVLRYFPVIPRLRQLFRCRELASLMSWHHDNASKDGVMRIPADGAA